MPRPKVPPNARRRVVQACQQCKASKRKCNALLPCNHCIKRGIAEACDISDPGSTRKRSTTVSSQAERRRASLIQSDPSPADNVDVACQIGNSTATDDIHSHVDLVTGNGSYETFPASSPDSTRARMLSNNAGEYVFFGRSASLSFMQLVQETVARCIGPCQFSEHSSRDHMLEVDLDSNASADASISLELSQIDHCVEYYFLATTGLVDVMNPAEAKKLLAHDLNDDSYLAVVRLLVIAIGVQTAPNTDAETANLEANAISKARAIMFKGMLESPSIDMIRSFLLLAFYMLGACHRNAAFIYLGIAARAAHTLGLHTVESYSVLNENRRHTQLRCWKSLVSFDLIVCSILGRSTAILAQRNVVEGGVKITERIDERPSMELEAVYRLAMIVDHIASQFNGKEPITVGMAQSHLQNLKIWSSSLPPSLRPSTVPEKYTSHTRQSLLGCMHISCFYYFAVMLVTRPFLIMHLTPQLIQNNESENPDSAYDHEDVQELASACLNAATYMAQTCVDLLNLGFLAENMCILKAWIFAAGLVLGFEMFANPGHNRDVERAFSSCRNVLQKLASKSPQASQYQEILSLLSAAVDKHRKLRSARNVQKEGSLVARIMNLQSQDDLGQSTMQFCSSDDQFGALPSGILLSSTGAKDVHDADRLDQDDTADFMVGMDDLQIPSLENFMFDLQNFGMMPWGPS